MEFAPPPLLRFVEEVLSGNSDFGKCTRCSACRQQVVALAQWARTSHSNAVHLWHMCCHFQLCQERSDNERQRLLADCKAWSEEARYERSLHERTRADLGKQQNLNNLQTAHIHSLRTTLKMCRLIIKHQGGSTKALEPVPQEGPADAALHQEATNAVPLSPPDEGMDGPTCGPGTAQDCQDGAVLTTLQEEDLATIRTQLATANATILGLKEDIATLQADLASAQADCDRTREELRNAHVALEGPPSSNHPAPANACEKSEKGTEKHGLVAPGGQHHPLQYIAGGTGGEMEGEKVAAPLVLSMYCMSQATQELSNTCLNLQADVKAAAKMTGWWQEEVVRLQEAHEREKQCLQASLDLHASRAKEWKEKAAKLVDKLVAERKSSNEAMAEAARKTKEECKAIIDAAMKNVPRGLLDPSGMVWGRRILPNPNDDMWEVLDIVEGSSVQYLLLLVACFAEELVHVLSCLLQESRLLLKDAPEEGDAHGEAVGADDFQGAKVLKMRVASIVHKRRKRGTKGLSQEQVLQQLLHEDKRAEAMDLTRTLLDTCNQVASALLTNGLLPSRVIIAPPSVAYGFSDTSLPLIRVPDPILFGPYMDLLGMGAPVSSTSQLAPNPRKLLGMLTIALAAFDGKVRGCFPK